MPKKFENIELSKKWTELKKIRDVCNISIEAKRATKDIGSSLEANLTIKLNEQLFKITKNIDFSELCITSSAKIEKNNENKIDIKTEKAKGKKCPVCWKIKEDGCDRHPAQI